METINNTTEKLLIIKDLDLPFDYPSESFESVLAEVGRKFPKVFIRIRNLNGPGGSWPNADVIVPESVIVEFLEFFGNDDIEFVIESAVAL